MTPWPPLSSPQYNHPPRLPDHICARYGLEMFSTGNIQRFADLRYRSASKSTLVQYRFYVCRLFPTRTYHKCSINRAQTPQTPYKGLIVFTCPSSPPHAASRPPQGALRCGAFKLLRLPFKSRCTKRLFDPPRPLRDPERCGDFKYPSSALQDACSRLSRRHPR